MSPSESPKPSGETPVQRQIAEIWGRYRHALEQGDAEGVAATFTEDAVLMEPFRTDIVGRDRIRSYAEGIFARAKLSGVSNRTHVLDIYESKAYEFGVYMETIRFEGDEPTDYPGRYAAVWRRLADGAWRVERMMINRLPKEGP